MYVPSFFQRAQSWLRARPIMADGLTALLLACATVPLMFLRSAMPDHQFNQPDALNAALVAAAVLALALRRRFPGLVLAFVLGVGLFLGLLGYAASLGDVIAYLVAIYSVAVHRGLAFSLTSGLVALVSFVFVISLMGANSWDLVSEVVIFSGTWSLGRSLRLRRAYLAELEARARRLERARESDARAARTEERSRIARELHDVVAHHVSVMTVQAGAARRILERDPDAVRDALTTIEQLGRTALGEMRSLVGVLRTEAEPSRSELSPQPGVHDVVRLVDHMRETGLQVQLWIEGDSRQLKPGIDLAAFRLIQEALTNTLKHAGPHARAWVRIHYADRQLTVEVEDDGRGLVAGLGQQGRGRGHGLVGMRERVALYGGDLRIGPRGGGGFEVRARFPLEV